MFNIVYYYRIIESSVIKNVLFIYFFKTRCEKYMSNINKSLDYISMASLFEGEGIKILVAYKGEKKLENFFILNEFSYNNENLEKFKILFNMFNSPEKPKEFVDFFVENEKFYAVFTYHQEDSVNKKYSKNLNTAHFNERCKILETILIYFESIYRFPRCILGCLSEPGNIRVDEEKNVYFIYDLRNMDKYSDETKNLNLIFQNIAHVICIFLETEVQAKFNKELHIVVDKCKRGVYSSIPQMAVELKRAERISMNSSWFSYIKYQLSLRKDKIAKMSKVATASIIALGAVYLVYSKLNEGQNAGTAPTMVSIGGVNYTGDTQDESDKTVSTENVDNQTGEVKSADIVLSPGLDIQYEDYIVQNGDTITSICNDYYKDEKFVTAVASFNGLDVNDMLTAGSILKLPNRTAVALYTSK